MTNRSAHAVHDPREARSAFCEVTLKQSRPQAACAALPRVVFIEQVAEMIGKTATTIRTCATNAKYAHLIPRPWKMPSSRRLCWYEHEVLAWIESSRPAEPPPPKRPRGRPTKVEQLARQRWASGIADRSTQGEGR
jgi:predicted DNA-binding transcriptional regulator AlpA